MLDISWKCKAFFFVQNTNWGVLVIIVNRQNF